MDYREILPAVESILFASGDPVSSERVAAVLETDTETVAKAAQALAEGYIRDGRGIRLVKLEDSLQLCSAPENGDVVRRALETRRPPQLTQTALEVLAIIAYYQPATRARVEQIRGVDSAYTVGSLVEKGLIEPCGKLKVAGRPTVYRTTKAFLRTFGLSSVEELPMLPDAEKSEAQIELENVVGKMLEMENGQQETAQES